jgi:hypothetical protein
MYRGGGLTRLMCIFRETTFCLFVCFWRDSPQWTRASSFTRFLDHTQRRTTVGRTPLWTSDQPIAETYTWQHNTQKRQTSMPPVGFEPTISVGEQPQTYVLDRAAAWNYITYVKCNTNWLAIRFYLLLNAPTCFGLTCWPSSGSFL